MLNRKDALMRAKRFRTCPPAWFGSDPRCEALVAEHLRICPYCATVTEMDPWQELAEGLRGLLQPSTAPDIGRAPVPGEVRQVKWEKALWREAMHYNPPAVVVVEVVENCREAVLVAQIYHDIAMAAPGDLIVADPEAPEQAFFIETWNIYTLRASDLSVPLFSLDSRTMIAIDALRNDQSFAPPGFPVTVPMRADDARIHFREMEVETAYIFSFRAVSSLAAELEEKTLPDYASAGVAREHLKSLEPGIFWPDPPRTVVDVLLLARLPDDRLPLAAADGVETGGFAALYMFHQGCVVALSPLRFQVFKDSRIENLRTVSGRVQGGSQELSGADFLCLYVNSTGETISPSRAAWDDETGEFYAEFPLAGSGQDRGIISLALVKEADGV